ncbi:MAG: hypothetical protein Q8R02_12325 [Hyphomonadaceae bacterium]|nr:hypothetical protein [Hyphomonadaceae bacterium]
MSSPPSSGTRPQRPKTAAQRASEANTLQQRAVHTHTARPSDRQGGEPTGQQQNESGREKPKQPV